MRNKFKRKVLQSNRRFLDVLQVLTDYMDGSYPGWRDGKDKDYVLKRLNQTAKIMSKNKNSKKIKLLHKKDFKEWPFLSDRIVIIQTSKKMISCIIDFHEYALNGLAETGLKLKFPHDCGKARMGESVSTFIKIGMEL
jgi:hypothetical protein